MIEDKDTWMYVGKNTKFYPFNPSVESISIDDIAHSLSKQCRFLGHLSGFYSVAEHSIHVANCVQRYFYNDKSYGMFVKYALLHDATETYIGDMSSPLKHLFPEYQKLEKSIMEVIAKKFNLIWPVPTAMLDITKYFDKLLLSTEVRKLKRYTCQKDWNLLPPMDTEIIKCWLPSKAKFMFLTKFRMLFGMQYDKEIFC